MAALDAKALLHVTSRRLGDGTSAAVHVGTLRGQEVAVKVSVAKEDARRQVRREARRYLRIREHRNVVRCLGVAESADAVVLVTELMRGGSLFGALGARNGKLLPKDVIVDLAAQLARAVAHCHASGFSIGDVKSLNVLLTEPLDDDGRLPDGGCVKLCDFGLSRRLSDSSSAESPAEADKGWLGGTTAGMDPNSVAGTFAYLAPEGFEGLPQTAGDMIAADVYALGVVLWELATVQVPWDRYSLGALLRIVREDKKLPFPAEVRKHVGERYVQLCKRMWARDPAKRPSSLEVVRAIDTMLHRNDAHSPAGAPADSPMAYTKLSPAARSDALETGSSDVSNESAELASIVSLDDDFVDDDGSFEIQLSLLPGAAEALERKEEVLDASDSDTSSSDDDDYSEYHSFLDDPRVAGQLDDITVLEVNDSGQLSEVEDVVVYGEVVEIDDDVPALCTIELSPAKEGTGDAERATCGQGDAGYKHVRFHAHDNTLPAPGSSLTTIGTGRVSAERRKSLSPPASTVSEMGEAVEQDGSGVYMPEEFAPSGPSFLEATNGTLGGHGRGRGRRRTTLTQRRRGSAELSEFDFTFQDGCSTGSTQPAKESVRSGIVAQLKQQSAGGRGASPTRCSSPRRAPLRENGTSDNLRLRRDDDWLRAPRSKDEGWNERPAVRRAASNPVPAPTLRRAASVRRTYTSQAFDSAEMQWELERLESEDVNADVLGSVMRYRKLVTRYS